jgi:predicted transcriptional regulator of viral defense system
MQTQIGKSHRPRDFFASHPVFTHAEFVQAHTGSGRSQHTSNSLLAERIATGSLVRIKRGVYATVPVGTDAANHQPPPPLVAAKLADDAVVAYHSALEFHGCAYSLWTREQYLTASRLAPLRFRGVEYIAVQAPRAVRDLADFGGGVEAQPYAEGTVRVTTLERTLVDLLHTPGHGGGWEEIWRSLAMADYFELDAVLDHALLMGSALTVARVGLFLEQNRESLMVPDAFLARLAAHVPPQPMYLDRHRKSGRLIKPWNLIVPEVVLARAWEEPHEDRA